MQKTLLKPTLLTVLLGLTPCTHPIDYLKVATAIDDICGGNFYPITNVLNHYITKKNIGAGILTYSALFCGGLGMVYQRKADRALDDLSWDCIVKNEVLFNQHGETITRVKNIIKKYNISHNLHLLSISGMGIASYLDNNKYKAYATQHMLTCGILYMDILKHGAY